MRDAQGKLEPRAWSTKALGTAPRRFGPPSLRKQRGQVDSEALHRDRLASLGELVGELVHELRNPLVPIKTFIDLIPQHLDDAEFTSEFRALVQDELARLERMLDTLARQASPGRQAAAEQGQEAANLLQELDTIAALLAPRARDREIQLAVRTSPAIAPARIDPDGLRQILLNLVLNALKATPQGGRVLLCAEPEARGHWLRLQVQDTGPGVPAELREHLFEPYVTTRRDRPGGLGLAIAQRLVEDAGGQITADDAPSGGARFSLRLPTLLAPPRATAPPSPRRYPGH